MLDKNQDAKFIAFEYPYSANRVRFHRHTDTNELWVVLADICNILNLANVTYTASKIDSNYIYKHKVLTDGGKQTVTWVHIDKAISLCREHSNLQLEWWLFNKKTVSDSGSNYTFKEGITVEKETILKILQLFEEIKTQVS